MGTFSRLDKVFDNAFQIEFDDESRIVLFSDLHRGDDRKNDDFAQNRNMFEYALKYYFRGGFTYIELGDGDELWENKRFAAIRKAHETVFNWMRKYHVENRLFMLFGNHDMERKYQSVTEKYLHTFYDGYSGTVKPLFDGITVYEGIRLRHRENMTELFLVHGHQGDLINDRWWKIGRFFVRYVWAHLQLIGFHDPSSPAREFKKRRKVENKLIAWARDRKKIIITGHTHRSMFARKGRDAAAYFNTGNGVHPSCITALEIKGGKIRLVMWRRSTKSDGTVYIERRNMSVNTPLETYKRFYEA